MGLGECLDALQRSTRYSERRGQLGTGKGIGLAGSAYISGAGLPIYWNEMPHSGAEIRIDRGGGVTVYCGTAEIGQGSDNMLASITAEALGVMPEDVHVVSGDTSLAPVDLGSYSSRVTFMAGNAVKQAALKLRDQLAQVAAEQLGVPVEQILCAYRRYYGREDPGNFVSVSEAAVAAGGRFGRLSADDRTQPHNGLG